jgi:hypothetical protein
MHAYETRPSVYPLRARAVRAVLSELNRPYWNIEATIGSANRKRPIAAGRVRKRV